MPRSLTGSHEPTWALTKTTPFGPVRVVGRPWMLVPSARKAAMAGPAGVVTIQFPTIGWLAMASGVVSWAAAGWTVAARARPTPAALRPARAVRREIVSMRGVVMEVLLYS